MIKTKIKDRVAFMTIDNPPQNVINNQVLLTLKAELEKFEKDQFIRAVVLDSANQTPPFAADGMALLAEDSAEKQRASMIEGQTCLTYVENYPKPIIMAIYNGMCMGGGLELAFSCHMRVAGDQCMFSIPEAVAGAMPGWGNTSRLINLFGRARAIEMLLTGFQFNSEQMERWGGANYVVSGNKVLNKATELANKVAYMRTKSIEAALNTFNYYMEGNQEGKQRELDNYVKIYDKATFEAAIHALFEQKTIEFKD
jgi:enoyl-CoA hydratase/carnithine racemase